MQIGLIPLDERPVNTRYPRMLAAIAAVWTRRVSCSSWVHLATLVG